MYRTYGAVWVDVAPPSGPLSVRMLLSDESGDETSDMGSST
ncbi:Expansin-like B1 [Orobanche gracilis]